MNEAWQFVLNESSVHFLLSLKQRDRARLLAALNKISGDPMQKGNYSARDASGRTIQIVLEAPFLISFWPDSLIKELRVISIERVTSL